MSPEGFLEKKILPPYENKEITDRKYKAMLLLLKGALDDVDPKNRPTALDFQGIRPDMTEDDIISWVEKETGISRALILADKNSSDETLKKESSNSYKLLNSAYQEAKNFLRESLKYSKNQLNKDPRFLSSKEDLLSLLNKTKQIEGQGLHMSVIYCRLVKTTLATFETLKHDAKLLNSITRDFEKNMISPVVPGETISTPLISLDSSEGNKFYAKDNSNIEGALEARGKKWKAAVLKFITRPESSAKTALKDGIASRITIEENNAEELLSILYQWLTKDIGVSFINIENQAYFPKARAKKIKIKLAKLPEIFLPNTFSFFTGKRNSTSMGNFQALKMTGVIQDFSKENGESVAKNLSPHARQFEIQIVHPENENEKGKMHHIIYDVVKFVTARTRLDGSCPEDVFNEFVKDAHEESGMDIKDIIYYLTEDTSAPIVVRRKRNGKLSYVAHSVYLRWNGFGWVDSSLFDDIDDAKK